MRPCGSVVNPLPVTSVVQHGSSCGTRGGAALLFDLARARVQVGEADGSDILSASLVSTKYPLASTMQYNFI